MHTSTRAPVDSATAPMKSRAARHRVVEHHEVGLEQAGRLPRLAHGLGVGYAVDAVEQLQAGREASPVDRMGVQDEQLQLRSALSDVCIRA